MKSTWICLPFCLLLSCAISRPLSGPGFDKSGKKLLGNQERVVVVAMTNALLDRSKRKTFDQSTQSIYKNLENYSGYLAGSIRLKLLGEEVWTYTVWESEKDLKNFIEAREHLGTVYANDGAIKKIRSLTQKIVAKNIPTNWAQIEELISYRQMKDYKPL